MFQRVDLEKAKTLNKQARHHDLSLTTLANRLEDAARLSAALRDVSQCTASIGNAEAFNSQNAEPLISDLRDKLQDLQVVSRAKVTDRRIYSAVYHPEVSKDLIFFGDKHGQLGIWDARAPVDEVADEDGDVASADGQGGGRYWRLQLHWPETLHASISCVKIDPIDAHNIYTSSYDGTIRSLSLTSGVSKEIFSFEETRISNFDIASNGREIWASDVFGRVWHLDLRQVRSKATLYELGSKKIGCISVNPTQPHFILTASNERFLKIYDARRLQTISPDALRGEARHEKSVTSAYWDPRGRDIVSTSFDNTLRLWGVEPSQFETENPLASGAPASSVSHNCQTGRYVTML
ncbi:WD40-repeat-containing domain protein, partial [Mycena olivaceomarginata]